MFIKMRVLIRIIVVFLCAYLITVRQVRGEDLEPSEENGESETGRGEDQRKDGKSGALSGGGRRSVVQQINSNATRDSQLLTLLAARRRQLLSGRLATHISNLASLVHKPHKSNTTFAQLEIRDTNSSTLKRITFDNSSNEAAPTLKLVSHDGTKEIRQDIKPHEIRTHLFIPKLYQDNRSRTGFINIRRKDALNRNHNVTEITTEQGVVYVPPEKLEGLDKEVILDPEEEFQVDESNHGLYLLNFSDTENITQGQDLNKTINIGKQNITKVEITTFAPNTTTTKDTVASKPDENKQNNKTETNVIANSTDTKLNEAAGIQVDKDKENNTLFMSDEIYNHFRPLETELPEEDMAPFHVFGKKLDVQAISDNLTNSPSLSASTKSVNFIAAPPEKRKFNSRYSATEKYKNTSVDEEEFNEDMDVSVVKNIIEKNKVRNTVKGPAPGRHIGLVNAYRKHVTSSTTTHKPLNIAQLNVTEPIVQNITPISLNTSADGNRTNNVNINKEQTKNNSTNNSKEVISNRTNTTLPPRNYTRNYFNLRRRPSRVTTLPTTETISPAVNLLNTTTEKASTSVYTAVVTSISITSSMKGQNKTDDLINSDNSTVLDIPGAIINSTTEKPTVVNVTETTSPPSTLASSTYRSYRHKIRIRTTTPESSLKTSSSPIVFVHKSTESPISRDLSTRNSADLQNESTTSRISERLANLFRQNSYDDQLNSTNGTIRPKSLRRRRPTTTTTTSIPRISTLQSEYPSTTALLTTPAALTTHFTTNKYPETTENTFIPYIVTSKTSSESSSKPFVLPNNKSTQSDLVKTANNTEDGEKENSVQNEEVVIEADKNYTASYILAGLGFLPVMAIVAFLLRNILNKKTKEIDTEYEGYFEDSDVKKESPITPVARPPMPTPSKLDQKWEFPRNKLRLQTLLGQGNFGQVWKAEADDLNGHDGLTRLVAVKSIKETASQKEKQELLHEIYIMQKIGTHPNVVTLLACCTEQEPYLLIMEYVMCGKLLTYLRERRSRPDRFSGSGALTSKDLTVFAYCVARGMDYIASKGIVHRDMAARNVLVDHNKLCKIADFGMSRATGGASRNRGALPVRWMAPEALLYNVYSHETDVWAFGILLWEIVTLGSTPYAAMSGREVLAAVTEGYRLERPPHCKPQLYRAMHSCWHADPTQRPSFATLKSQLAELLDNEPSEGNYVDLDSFYQDSSVYSDPSAIIHDDDGLSAEYDRERSSFRELAKDSAKYDKRAFSFRDEELRNKFSIGAARMGGFGIRDVPFNERNFSDGEFNERTFDKNFNDTNFTERKDGKLSTSSFHRERNERERENPIVSRNSFNGFPRLGTRENHFQILQDGRNKRVSEFECDI